MKSFYLIIVASIFFANNLFTQGVCAVNFKIVSPVVAKPTDALIVSASCSTFVVKWKGGKDQTYLVTGSFTDQVSNISCDINYNCTAVIPVTPGSKFSWSVQAITVIDGRTFYSYPSRGEQDYLVPACNQPITVAGKSAPEEKSDNVSVATTKDKLIISNDKFALYPNPVNDLVNINLNSEYKGNIKVTILDASGKAVKIMALKKEQSVYNGRVAVGSLKPGLYFISVEMQKGQSYVTKFLKN